MDIFVDRCRLYLLHQTKYKGVKNEKNPQNVATFPLLSNFVISTVPNSFILSPVNHVFYQHTFLFAKGWLESG